MNKLTLVALLGLATAEDFIGNDKCAIADSTRMEDREFARQVTQGTWQNIVKGAYHSKTDLISNECLGDWMIPTMDKIFKTAIKVSEDPMSITIDEAYDVATNTVDLYFKNRDTCQFTKVYDDYKNWCLNNLDTCVGADEGFLKRVYDHGYDLFGAFYDLVGILAFEQTPCETDTEFISQYNRLIADTSSILSVVVGFEADYNVTSNHVTIKSFNQQINDYFDSIYSDYFYDYDMSYYGYEFESPDYTWFEWEEPTFDMPTFEMPTYELSYEMDGFDMPPFPEFPELTPMPEFPKFNFDFHMF
jgi:hypothetical protein